MSELRNDILATIKERKVVYQRELQVLLEDKYSHWDVYNELKKLEKEVLCACVYRGRKWYWLAKIDWFDVKSIANRVAGLMDVVSNHPRKYTHLNIEYLDYAEYLVEQAFIKSGYIVVSKDTYYFNGVVYRPPGPPTPGRPRDLDFILNIPEKKLFIGVQVKNQLRYPERDDIDFFLDIVTTLRLKPLLIVRMAHEMQLKRIIDIRGKVIVFKRLIL